MSTLRLGALHNVYDLELCLTDAQPQLAVDFACMCIHLDGNCNSV